MFVAGTIVIEQLIQQKKIAGMSRYWSSVLNSLANHLEVLIVIYFPEMDRVEYVSDSTGWLFGMDREQISSGIDALFENLKISGQETIVQEFRTGTAELSAQKEFAIVDGDTGKARWIRLRTMPCERGRFLLMMTDCTEEHMSGKKCR